MNRPEAVYRFNCHGLGLNEAAQEITREALDRLGLMSTCTDFAEGVTKHHLVAIKRPGSNGDRVILAHLRDFLRPSA